MSDLTRRSFLRSALAGAPGVALAGGAVRAFARERDDTEDSNGKGFTMGAQSYSFRNFSFEDSLQQLKDLGLNNMEYCGVHFPADKDDPNFAAVKAAIAAAGVNVLCYGVEEFTADVDANRKKFEFGKALGLDVLSANPTADSFDNLNELVEEYKIKIGIHNHGPGARYDGVQDTLNAVKGRSPLIGACVDTGHAIRSGEKPHEVISALGDRVISLHLKDWIHGGEETVIGAGDLDLVAVAKALKAINFSGPIMMEYENHPDNPVPHMKKGWDNWTAAAAQA